MDVLGVWSLSWRGSALIVRECDSGPDELDDAEGPRS
jgi:hypothetical protein